MWQISLLLVAALAAGIAAALIGYLIERCLPPGRKLPYKIVIFVVLAIIIASLFSTLLPEIIAPPAVTLTPTPIPDLRLGYVDRGMGCPLVTEITELILERDLKPRVIVESRKYDTPGELFTALESEEIDLTMCFLYPDDKDYKSTRIAQIGSFYRESDRGRWQIFASDSSRARLREEGYPYCVYDALRKIKIESLDPPDADRWIKEHWNEVKDWIDCNP